MKSAPSNEWPPRVSVGYFNINCRILMVEKFDRLHAEGYLSRETHDIDETPLDLSMIRQRCNAVDMSGTLNFQKKKEKNQFIYLSLRIL